MDEQDPVWPLPQFYFSVDISGIAADLPFQEVSGLDAETDVIEYRAGNSKVFSPIKMPGMVKAASVTLKKGVVPKNSAFFDWFSQIQMNILKRETVTIKLLDQEGNATMVWQLANAFPTKVSNLDFTAEGNEIAIETLELAHEGLKIQNA